MARTRAVPRQRLANINFNLRRVAAAKEITNRRMNRADNIKIKLPRGKDVEVKQRGVVVRRIEFERSQYSLVV